MRRLKKRSTSPGVPTVKKPAFSRKNGRFSGIEEVEAVEVDLLLVGLDLGEVGVERYVEGEGGGDATT